MLLSDFKAQVSLRMQGEASSSADSGSSGAASNAGAVLKLVYSLVAEQLVKIDRSQAETEVYSLVI